MRHRAPFNERPAVVSRNRQVLPHWCNSGEATMSLNDTTPTPRGATAGIDWASDNHAVCVLDPDGAVIERQTVAHTAAGLRRLIDLLSRHRVQAVGIERGDGPVIDALLATDLTIYVMADTIRTDRHRLTPLVLDSGATTALRRLCRARRDLVAHRVAVANQLRAHLATAMPAAVDLFADLDSPISLRFLARFSTQDDLDWLSVKRISAWLASASYSGHTSAQTLYGRFCVEDTGATGTHGQALAGITRAYLATLTTITAQIHALKQQITQAFDAHPDKPVFAALPKAGTVRAARLLAEIGDARGRFPTPDSLACLAGAAPSTRQSGKVKIVAFRWAVDKQLRDAVCDFAGDSRHANAWAADLYNRARTRGHDHPHAVRILARAWLDVIWKCWTTNTAYDPDQHRALQRLTKQDQPMVA